MANNNRITIDVEMLGIYEYTTYMFYKPQHHYIYKMQDASGKVYVWKTTSYMVLEEPYDGEAGHHNFEDKKGNPVMYSRINKGDKITITGTVKGESEYKGEPQTELTRCVVKARSFKAETEEERMARLEAEKQARIDAQYASIKGKDFIWRMPYKQYKEHYADCETIEGSFRKDMHERQATIEVIIRENRLKASGTRGKSYAGYHLKNENGEHITYRAVSEENAIRRAKKEIGGEAWKVVEIFDYHVHRIW